MKTAKLFTPVLCALLATLIAHEGSAKSLRPPADKAEDVSNAYRDMIVVQRKAKEKAGHYLFSSHIGTEFSDGPQSVYNMNFNFGYAITDHWEIYANIAPLFLVQDRNIKKQVSGLVLQNNQRADLIAAEPNLQYGVELLWAPAYGKDSWGPFSIVRSDTFFKLYFGFTQFDIGKGPRYGIGIGKTFFLSRYFNLRFSANFVMQETLLNNSRYLAQAGVFEFGSVWYF